MLRHAIAVPGPNKHLQKLGNPNDSSRYCVNRGARSLC
ncbi:hypothetical protein L915_17184 [Phytophthora nicotianae]|uniref:Uncharacterized protein n=1 Tax=Phytophthora nicotianae TaxID=4792 RepID=W2G0E7_PHYNI|nr:hypothetical protein L915_17184 [Phytophthora nicotianae]